MQDIACFKVVGGPAGLLLMARKVALCFCVTIEKYGKIVIPLPLKDIRPFTRAVRTASMSLKCNSLISMARGGAPEGKGCRGTMCIRSMANNGEKVETPKVEVNHCL